MSRRSQLGPMGVHGEKLTDGPNQVVVMMTIVLLIETNLKIHLKKSKSRNSYIIIPSTNVSTYHGDYNSLEHFY